MTAMAAARDLSITLSSVDSSLNDVALHDLVADLRDREHLFQDLAVLRDRADGDVTLATEPDQIRPTVLADLPICRSADPVEAAQPLHQRRPREARHRVDEVLKRIGASGEVGVAGRHPVPDTDRVRSV